MRYRFSDLTLSSDEPLPELTPATDGDAEVQIDWLSTGPPEQGAVFQTWMTPSDTEWLTFADADNGLLLTFVPHSQFWVSCDGRSVRVYDTPDTPVETTRHLLLNQVLPLVLSRRGRVVLHASAISWNGQVSAFIEIGRAHV